MPRVGTTQPYAVTDGVREDLPHNKRQTCGTCIAKPLQSGVFRSRV